MVYVITGGPGFGKTTLINHLSKKGFLVGSESAREIIEQQQASGGEILPWRDIKRFEKMVAQQRIQFLESIPEEEISFSDRGLPDQIAYSWYKSKPESDFLKELVNKHRYAPTVFITPPWKAIYINDETRQESFQTACEIHSFIIDSYTSSGYTLVELPLTTPTKRVDFILQTIDNQRNHEHHQQEKIFAERCNRHNRPIGNTLNFRSC